MLEIFLNKYNLNKVEIAKIERDLMSVLFVKILYFSQNRISDSESLKLKEYILAKKFDEVLAFVKSKYSENEWQSNLRKHIYPLFESYINEVLQIG